MQVKLPPLSLALSAVLTRDLMIGPQGALMALSDKEMVMVHGGEGPKHIMLSYQVRKPTIRMFKFVWCFSTSPRGSGPPRRTDPPPCD